MAKKDEWVFKIDPIEGRVELKDPDKDEFTGEELNVLLMGLLSINAEMYKILQEFSTEKEEG